MIRIDGNNWIVSIDLTFKNMADFVSQIKKKYPNAKTKWEINISEVKNIDSAGLAWLLQCIQYAKKFKINLELKNMNQAGSWQLAEVHGLKDIFKKVVV